MLNCAASESWFNLKNNGNLNEVMARHYFLRYFHRSWLQLARHVFVWKTVNKYRPPFCIAKTEKQTFDYMPNRLTMTRAYSAIRCALRWHRCILAACCQYLPLQGRLCLFPTGGSNFIIATWFPHPPRPADPASLGCVHGLVGGIDNIHESLVGADLLVVCHNFWNL